MHLFEAIVDANHRAIAGDASAGLRPADFEKELPVIALTCIDPRLNALFPNVLGLPGEQFIWLRNAGNIITGPLSSTMRSLALACAVKEGMEIAIIGHSDCQVCKTTTMQLLDRFKSLGIARPQLPENITEYFGLFSSERQNVIKACDFVRQSPIIGRNIPVHGLLVDITTGKLEWVVNGYQNWEAARGEWKEPATSPGHAEGAWKPHGDSQMGEMKLPEMKMGAMAVVAEDWLAKKAEVMKPAEIVMPPVIESGAQKLSEVAEALWPKSDQKAPPQAHPPPIPPPVRPRLHMRPKQK